MLNEDDKNKILEELFEKSSLYPENISTLTDIIKNAKEINLVLGQDLRFIKEPKELKLKSVNEDLNDYLDGRYVIYSGIDVDEGDTALQPVEYYVIFSLNSLMQFLYSAYTGKDDSGREYFFYYSLEELKSKYEHREISKREYLDYLEAYKEALAAKKIITEYIKFKESIRKKYKDIIKNDFENQEKQEKYELYLGVELCTLNYKVRLTMNNGQQFFVDDLIEYYEDLFIIEDAILLAVKDGAKIRFELFEKDK